MFFKYIASRILPFWIVLENQDCGVCEVMQAVVDFCDGLCSGFRAYSIIEAQCPSWAGHQLLPELYLIQLTAVKLRQQRKLLNLGRH
jgi:hypothetical protein